MTELPIVDINPAVLDSYFVTEPVLSPTEAFREQTCPKPENVILEKTQKKHKRNYQRFVKSQSDPRQMNRLRIMNRIKQKANTKNLESVKQDAKENH